MSNGFKTNFIGHEQNAPSAMVEETADETLTAHALEDIRSSERLSGFGRFAKKIQDVFHSAKPSQPKQQMPHLKAAPILMSAGLPRGVLKIRVVPRSSRRQGCSAAKAMRVPGLGIDLK